MSKVKVGDTLRDNDKRKPDRFVTITEVVTNAGEDHYVTYHTGKRTARILMKRIFTDDKPRQRGFNLVSP